MLIKRLQYRYDAVGNKVGMTDADGGLFTYTYDVMRRLTGVINPLGERTTYTYDLNGRRTSAQLSNGTRTSYSYDQGSRVQQIHTLKSNNSTVAKFDYACDDNGRRTSPGSSPPTRECQAQHSFPISVSDSREEHVHLTFTDRQTSRSGSA